MNKYFWLKLDNQFFKRHDIRIVENMPNGKDYILFYLKLLVESVSHEGELRFSDTIPYNDDMLSIVTNTNVDIVRSAMKVFTELGMIEVLEDETIFLAEINKMIGSETSKEHCDAMHRERQARYRAKKKALKEQNVTDSDVTRDVEIEKEIDIEIEKEIDIKKNKQKKNTFSKPSLDELKAFVIEECLDVDCEHFIDYYDSNGWMVGKNKMKDWRATARNWHRRNTQKKKGDFDEWREVIEELS